MEDSTRLSEPSEHRQHHHRHHYHHHHHHHHHHHRGRTPVGEFGDDECSTDSGCSSGGSTGSGERLSRRGSDEWPGRSGRSPRSSHCYLERLRASGRSTRSQDRDGGGGGSSLQRSSERAWSPEDVRSLPRGGLSPSPYSSSPSDAHSSSDSDSLKRPSTTETLRRAFQSLKINSAKWEGAAKEKKHAKKSPKRILRSPVPYMYVRGLSGLPTLRVPRNGLQQIQPCSCQDLIGLYL
ncbi:protein doublesex [Harpegnathos saltator]|uniref:protein doublesex n=1 Tax=Harpegnathos saltator TaxID=610380 RepID=UPI000DBEDB25|nr:protein doublesex [Harpegnathos saltator]